MSIVVKKLSTAQIDNKLYRYLVQRVEELFFREPVRVFLFGSRGRNEHLSRSDYDLAFDLPTITRGQWAKFAADVREEAPTLHGIDLVWLQDCSPDLYGEVLKEGVMIYEHKAGKEIR